MTIDCITQIPIKATTGYFNRNLGSMPITACEIITYI